MIETREDVARILFSPKMIHNGTLLPAAFELRSHISEDYLSVLRTSIPSWKEEMQLVPNRRNRTAIAYSTLNVGETRALSDDDTIFDVVAYPSEKFKSHAGITIKYKGEKVIGGIPIKQSSLTAESFIRLAIRYKLLVLARKEVHYL